MSGALERYRDDIRAYLDDDVQVSLFWKGRVALYAILKAMGVTSGDEVIVPAFTCVVVPNVIMYLGATPVYVDIEPQTFTIDVAKIEAKITSRTRVILAQNTFGLSSDIDEIMRIAEKHDLRVVEDCAHGFGGFYKGRPNGTIAHAAFYSSQWSKPYSTGLGGVAIARDAGLGARIAAAEREADVPTRRESLQLAVLTRAYQALVTPATYSRVVRIYRLLSGAGLVIGSSQSIELEQPVLPDNFLKGMSTLQAARGSWALKRFRDQLVQRKAVAVQYHGLTQRHGLPAVHEPAYAAHTFLRYAFEVPDKPAFLAEARKRNLECGDWFVSPIHPIEERLDHWQYAAGACPVAERVCAHIVNLPTHERVTKRYLQQVDALLATVGVRAQQRDDVLREIS